MANKIFFCGEPLYFKQVKKILKVNSKIEVINAYGPTETTFTHKNLETTFGGVLRHFVLGGSDLHADNDTRQIRVISDDERPFVVYGENTEKEK